MHIKQTIVANTTLTLLPLDLYDNKETTTLTEIKLQISKVDRQKERKT